jgi:hypothetical protein
MPKFLAGCHYNEEEISWHFQKKKKDISRSKLLATSLKPVKSLKKLVNVVKGQILAG